MIRAHTLEVKDTNIDPNDFQFHNHTAEAVLHYSTATSKPADEKFYDNVQQQNRDCTKLHSRQLSCQGVSSRIKHHMHTPY